MPDELLELFNITAEDLEINEYGELTHTQIEYLLDAQQLDTAQSNVIMRALFSFMFASNVFGLMLIGEFGSATYCGMGLIFNLYVLFVALSYRRRFSTIFEAYEKDIASGEVYAVEGSIKLRTVNKAGTNFRADYGRTYPTQSLFAWDYFARIADERYKISHEQFTKLKQNNTYLFFYVPHSMRVVSALHLASAPQVESTYTPSILLETSIFHPAKVEANQQGYLTDRQRGEIKDSAQSFLFYFWVVIIGMILFVLVIYFITSGIEMLYCAGISAFIGVLVSFVAKRILGNLPDYPKIMWHCGVVQKESPALGSGIYRQDYLSYWVRFVLGSLFAEGGMHPFSRQYILQMDEKSFSIPRDYFSQFTNGRKYCVYYIEGMNRIVSAEEILD